MAGALRITGGELARRRFAVPPAADRGHVRPTADRVREALFSSLGPDLAGAVVLDVFAGSGALGFEALSRGAERGVFVEQSAGVSRVLKQNLAALGLEGRAEVRIADARREILSFADAEFDLVLVDPPYAQPLDAAFLGELGRVLRPGGRLVIERDAKTAPIEAVNLSLCRDRVYGNSRVSIWQRAAV